MSEPRVLLCSDMDRTVIPNGVHPENQHARRRFRQFCADARITLVYVTGRHRGLVQQALKHYALPAPDYVITDVGSKIYRLDAAGWQEMQRWESTIDKDWNGHSHAELKQLLRPIKELRLQETSKQNTHKLSYYLPLYIAHAQVIQRIADRFEAEGIRCNIIYSVDEMKNLGLLDILPAGANKLHAIRFLRQQLGYAEEDVIFAGDSGNDLEVLTSGLQAVLVANASADIKSQALERVARDGHPDSLYVAAARHLNMNGNYCAGVLEGVWHFAPALRDLITGTEQAHD